MSDKKDPAGPADTRVMRIVHNALRRDLARTRDVLTTPPYPHPAQRRALAAHLEWMVDFLHHHHEGEDTGLYPVVRARNPEAVPLLDAMDAEHHAIGPGMDGLVAAARAYAADAGARAQVLGAIAALEETLLPHLRREEDEMMPVVSRSITQADWDRWDREVNVGPKPKSQLAREGLWIMEDQTAEDRRAIELLVPPVPRWLILHVLSRGYRREAFQRWWSPQYSPWSVPVTGTTSVETEAAPEEVWAVLADVTRVGEWSHECRGAEWLDGATAGGVGVRFRGRNQVRFNRWSRACVIDVWEPAREVVWHSEGPAGLDSTQWRVTLEPHGSGTRVTQTYTILAMQRWFSRFVWLAMPEHRDRAAALRQDLERLGDLARSERQVRGPARQR